MKQANSQGRTPSSAPVARRRRSKTGSGIVVKFNWRFWTSLPATRAGLAGVGAFVHCAHYAAEWGHIDGVLPVLPFSARDRPNRMALAAAIDAGLMRKAGENYELCGRGNLWTFYNPVPISAVDRPRIVAALVARDGRCCAYCKRTGALTIDHVIPRSQGGTNDISNLVLACADCNSSKGNRTVDQWCEAGLPQFLLRAYLHPVLPPDEAP